MHMISQSCELTPGKALPLGFAKTPNKNLDVLALLLLKDSAASFKERDAASI